MSATKRKMNVLLIGWGSVGKIIAQELAKENLISTIVCASRKIPLRKPKSQKIKFRQLDAQHQDQIELAARGMNLVINASLPQYNISIMKAALKAGAHYQDLCSYLRDHKTPEQLQLHRQFQGQGLVGLINTGISPGITNLLIREAADQLQKVNSIKIRVLQEENLKKKMFAWSPEVTVLELTVNPLVYRQGKNKFVRPFANEEQFHFPSIGNRKMYAIYGDEVATLPRYITTKNIDYKCGGTAIEEMRPLLKKYSAAEILTRVSGPDEKSIITSVQEGMNAVCAMAVVVEGKSGYKKKNVRFDVFFPDLQQVNKIFPGAGYISYPTAIAAAVFARNILSLPAGVYPPEALEKDIREKIMMQLKSKGIKIVRHIY
ncbi:MAG: saccharopine dehydrogenase NADP-binding domain-containing protein [Nanoarchaeota archaeon]|nr:saccharopine dehydrogenase NADP-binding domain-containing protein [Nanoarchaeota archaeon]